MPRLLAHVKKSQNQLLNRRKGIFSVHKALHQLDRQFCPFIDLFWGKNLKCNLVPRILAHVEKSQINLIRNSQNTLYLYLASK